MNAIDALGTTRHITRDELPPDILREKPVRHGWDWAARCLWKSTSTDRLHINLLDTLLLDQGQIAMWLFTSSNGQVLRKSEKNCTLEKARIAFSKHLQQYRHCSFNGFAVVYESNGAAKVSYTKSTSSKHLTKSVTGVVPG